MMLVNPQCFVKVHLPITNESKDKKQKHRKSSATKQGNFRLENEHKTKLLSSQNIFSSGHMRLIKQLRRKGDEERPD